MVSVCLDVKADGTKLKSFVVYHAAKRESKSLDEEFESRWVVNKFGNAQMNEELITICVKQVLGDFWFNRRLLAWDSYECHMIDSEKKDMKR